MALNIKQIRILIIILIIFVIVLIAGYSVFNDNPTTDNSQDKYNKTDKTPEYEEESVKEASTTSIKVSGTDFKPNKKPQFKMEERFKYEITSSLGKPRHIGYFIKKTERIDRKDYFVIAITETGEGHDMNTNEIVNYSDEMAMYVNKETGEILKMAVQYRDMEITIKEGMLSAMLMDKSYFYDPWMLTLKENINWVQKINMTDEFGSAEGENKYKVMGIEKVNGKNSFKIEIAYMEKNLDTGVNEILYKKIHWVDVDKRILVKSQIKSENLVVEETNLISES